MPDRRLLVLVVLLAILLWPACSVRRFAVNRIGDALASGGSTYERDEDLELVGDALPFGLKLIESLLAESPRHKGLLLAACRGFTFYSYAYVHQQADRVVQEDLERGNAMRARARRLYARARRYGLDGLELSCPGIRNRLDTDPETAVAAARKRDVPLLYWNAAALGLAISATRHDAELLARLPEVEALLGRALELDEGWQEGALHEMRIVYEGARPGGAPPNAGLIKKHFERAVELSGGKRASLYVAYAEAMSIRSQDRAEFQALLGKAMSIDPDRYEEVRVSNLIAQQRARWLLGRMDELFLEEASTPEAGEKAEP